MAGADPGSSQFKLYTITPKHQREVFIVTTTSSFCCAYLLPSEVTPLCVSLGQRHANDENQAMRFPISAAALVMARRMDAGLLSITDSSMLTINSSSS